MQSAESNRKLLRALIYLVLRGESCKEHASVFLRLSTFDKRRLQKRTTKWHSFPFDNSQYRGAPQECL